MLAAAEDEILGTDRMTGVFPVHASIDEAVLAAGWPGSRAYPETLPQRGRHVAHDPAAA